MFVRRIARPRASCPRPTDGDGGIERSDRVIHIGSVLSSRVPDPVEQTDLEGVDHAWVMQTTFVLTIVVGAPVVAGASFWATLPTWAARASFAIRVGAVVWVLVALAVFLHARRNARQGDEGNDGRVDERNDGREDGEHEAGIDASGLETSVNGRGETGTNAEQSSGEGD